MSYSVLKAITGSCLEAFLAGISPPINVNIMLKIISVTPPNNGRFALILILLVNECIIEFIIGINERVNPIPIKPESKPIIKVSALKIEDIFFFDAPIERKMPISFVLSKTEIYVIIPIIIDDTTSEIETNAIKT